MKALKVLGAMLLGAVVGEFAAWTIGMIGWSIGSVALFYLFLGGVFVGPILGAIAALVISLRSLRSTPSGSAEMPGESAG